jgi:anthranilate phosphoribosyltransferase
MSDAIHNAISILLKESSLSENEMHAAVLQVMDGNASAIGLGLLLTALRLKGETVDEIVGAARALRERAIRIPTQRPGLLDTCGTGGDELSTFNISTATAIVTAACGVPVAKHSNRGFSSRSGSADVLESLGVRIDLTPQEVARAIDEIGIGFCFAPVAHGAMKYAAPVRKQLGFRTVFNMLGPLTNPAGAEFQLVGAGRIAIAEKLAEALVRLGTTRALVVCGNDELDEVSLWGTTTLICVEDGKTERLAWTAKALGLEECAVSDLRAASIAESARTIRDVLTGAKGPARNIVLANAAAALIVAQNYGDPREAVAVAASAIDSGRARGVLERLTHFAASPD